MNKLNISGVDEFFISIFKKSYEFLIENNSCKVLDNDPDTLRFFMKKFFEYGIFSHPFNLKNVIELNLPELTYYIFFIEIDIGYSFSNKYGQRDEGLEYQVWAYANMKKTFGQILVKPKEVQDKVSHFLSTLFTKKKQSNKNVKFLSTRYLINGNEKDIDGFLTENINSIILELSDVNMLIVNHDIIAGFYKEITVSKVQSLNKLFLSIGKSH